MQRTIAAKEGAILLTAIAVIAIALVGVAAAYSPAGKSPRQMGETLQPRQAYLPGVWQSVPAKGWFAPRHPAQMNVVGVMPSGTLFDRSFGDVPAAGWDSAAARTQPPMGMIAADALSAGTVMAMQAGARDVRHDGQDHASAPAQTGYASLGSTPLPSKRVTAMYGEQASPYEQQDARTGYASLASAPTPSEARTAMYGGTHTPYEQLPEPWDFASLEPSLEGVEPLPEPWDFASLEAGPEAMAQLAAMYGVTSTPDEQPDARTGYASLASAPTPSKPLVAMYGGDTSPAGQLTARQDDTPLPAFAVTPVVNREEAGGKRPSAAHVAGCPTDDQGRPAYTQRWTSYPPVRTLEMPENTAQLHWAFTMDRERAPRDFTGPGIRIADNSRVGSH